MTCGNLRQRPAVNLTVVNEYIEQSRWTCVSFLCFASAWLLLCSFLFSGLNSHPSNWWITTWVFAAIFSAPAGALAGILGLIFDRKKPPAVVGLILNAISALLVLSIGG